MARLTNKQLEVLSTSIVDKLEEEYTKRKESFEESEEYKQAIKEFKASLLYEELQDLLKMKNEYDKAYNKIKEKVSDELNMPYHFYGNPSDWIERLKANKIKFSEKFEREKMMTKIQADILLGDSVDAKEIFDKLITKYEPGTNK